MTDLLAQVLPSEGWYCIIGLKQGSMPKQLFAETLDDANVDAKKLSMADYDVYFGCAKYRDKGSRAKTNAAFFKAFWLDIDCGANKPYATQADGIEALKQFCMAHTVPRPTIVNSGRGVHVYWPLTTVIGQEDWLVVAERLKELCVSQGLHADPVVTADAARILRVPETYNRKDPTNPLLVEVLHSGNPVDYEQFRQLLGVAKAPTGTTAAPFQPPASTSGTLNALTLSLLGNRISVFKTILEKTAAGVGCNQLYNIVINQATLEEPLWRAGLSIATRCEDRDSAIHNISKLHPNYDPAATEQKAVGTEGPYLCHTFENINPSGCDNCPHKGRISSPIVLGNDIAREEPEGQETEAVGTEEDASERDRLAIKVKLPWPYFRGKTGGIYREIKDDEPVLIYEHDLIVVQRLNDPIEGECALLKRFLPKEGWKEFTIPNYALTSRDELRREISRKGIIAHPKAYDGIMAYIVDALKNLQITKKADEMRTQFGWADEDTKFVVGEREVSATGVIYSPPSSSTFELAKVMEPKGSFDVWKEVFNTYAMEGFEPHAFAALAAFGSPLLKFLDLKGCLINLINNTSGTGKSTILRMGSSVYGHPEEMLLTWKDTYNSIINRAGVMNNLMLGIDEITKMKAELFSDLAYSITQGRGKNRMKHMTNEERVNLTKWANLWVSTSNASFRDKLSSLKDTPDGEMMRMLEYKIDLTGNLSKAKADSLFSLLHTNYGHAMVPYMQYVTANLEKTLDVVKRVQTKIDTQIGLDSRERFWSGSAACILAGGIISHNLNLHNIDMKRVYGFAVPMLVASKESLFPPPMDVSSIIGDFVNKHISNVLVIDSVADLRTGLHRLPIKEPHGELLIRYEPDTKELCVVRKEFRNFCINSQLTFLDVLASMRDQKVLISEKKRQLTRGTKLVAPPTEVLVFDCEAFGFTLGV